MEHRSEKYRTACSPCSASCLCRRVSASSRIFGLLGEYGAALAAALVVSTVLTLAVTVWVFVGVSRLIERES